MSLINDAIKRATAGASKPEAPGKGASHLHLEPVPARRPARWPILVMPLLLAGLVSLGVIFILKGWQTHQGELLPVSAREIVPAPAPDVPNAVPNPIPEAASSPGTPAVAASETAEVPAAVPAPPPAPVVPTFPDLKLKGILYRPSNPSAVINNKSVFVGERINDAQVIGITQDSVTVMWNDETRVLTMQ